MTESDIYLAASCFPALGPLGFKLLVGYFGSATKLWSAKPQKLAKLGLTTKLIDDWEKFKTEFDIAKYQHRLEKLNIKVAIPTDSFYPKPLKAIEDRPIALYFVAPKTPRRRRG